MISLYKIYKSRQLKMGEAVEIISKNDSVSAPIDQKVAENSARTHQEKAWDQQRTALMDQAEQDARELINVAEKEAAEILKQSYEESKEVLESSRAKGYQEGFEQGLHQGREAGYQEMTQLIDEAKMLKQESYDGRERLSKELEEQIVHLVIGTARRILQVNMQENQELVFQLIEDGLRKCNYTENLVIHVSEMDYDMVYAYQNRIYLMTDGIYEIEVKSDPSMSPGSVLIETASGQVDAGIETQIKQIESAFLELMQSEGSS